MYSPRERRIAAYVLVAALVLVCCAVCGWVVDAQKADGTTSLVKASPTRTFSPAETRFLDGLRSIDRGLVDDSQPDLTVAWGYNSCNELRSESVATAVSRAITRFGQDVRIGPDTAWRILVVATETICRDVRLAGR